LGPALLPDLLATLEFRCNNTTTAGSRAGPNVRELAYAC
jgi:hypothetical protein